MAKKLSDANGIKFAGAVNNNMSFVMVRPGQNAQMAISELAPGLNGRDGVDGKDGEPGAPGRDGADGRDGVDGKDGEPGAPGRDGADGRDGVDGKDGEPGPPGRDGTDGRDGADGRDGEPGAPGRDGTDGRDGVDGKDGEPGAPGRDGTDGRDGVDGKDGEPGAPGRDGTDGRDGVDGKDGEPGAPGSITNETYSTTEVDTGKTWINGKKIYRRVWQGTTNDVSSGTSPIGYSTWVMPDVIMFEDIIHSHLQLNYGPKGTQPSNRYVGGSAGTNEGYPAPWAFELTARTLYINFQNVEMRRRVSLAPITLILEYTKR